MEYTKSFIQIFKVYEFFLHFLRFRVLPDLSLKYIMRGAPDRPGGVTDYFFLFLTDLLSEVLRDGNEDEDDGGGEGVDECVLKRGCKLEAMAA